MTKACKCLTKKSGLCFRSCRAEYAGFKSYCFCGAEDPEFCEHAFSFGYSHFCMCPFAANMTLLALEHYEETGESLFSAQGVIPRSG